MIQGDCRIEGSGENGKGGELDLSGSSGGGSSTGTVEQFSTVYPFPQGIGYKSRGARMGVLDGSACLGHLSNTSELITLSSDAPYYSPNKLLNKLYEERVSRCFLILSCSGRVKYGNGRGSQAMMARLQPSH